MATRNSPTPIGKPRHMTLPSTNVSATMSVSVSLRILLWGPEGPGVDGEGG